MGKFVQTLNITEIDSIFTRISIILRIETPSYRYIKQKTDANAASVIIVVVHVFLERKPMAGLFQNNLLHCWMT